MLFSCSMKYLMIYSKPFILKTIAILFLSILFISCSSEEEKESERLRRLNQVGEYIYRKDKDCFYPLGTQEILPASSYPWESNKHSKYPVITKEFFRCKGCSLNPAKVVKENDKEKNRYQDCGGSERHGLPLRNGKEFVYPILIDLVNYIQNATVHKVVITSGHRCPDHNTYVDPSKENLYSKHMLAAEVSFYLQGLEEAPDKIISSIFQYYKESPKYQGKKEYLEFQRYDKETNVSTQPWYNKEIFVKLFLKNEGRNEDNKHPYPYVSIQVRYDEELKERVTYTWDKAQKNFLRW